MNSFRRYRLGSVALSIIFIVMIAWKWFQVQRIEKQDSVEIRDEQTLSRILSARDTIEFNSGTEAYEIPTGFFIQSIAFVTASDVNLTGYIWQKYPENFPPYFTKGVIFAEEVNSDTTTFRQMSTSWGEQNGIRYQMICWFFDVTVRQSFDYSKYPLDILTVWLRLWPKDLCMSEQILFIPDFDAYHDTSRNIFGVAPDIVQGEWVISESFYSYNNVSYDTDFGFFSGLQEQTYKEFYINVVMRRNFINAFVVNLVPLFVVALLLYAQIMTVSRDKEQAERFGFTASSAIATCSALFFIVLLAHIQIRQLFAGSKLVYIEYFYLIMYLAILGIALNAYVFSLGRLKRFNLIYYEDNLIPKLTYWPLLLGLQALMTWSIL